jgi:hypothetical protein
MENSKFWRVFTASPLPDQWFEAGSTTAENKDAINNKKQQR